MKLVQSQRIFIITFALLAERLTSSATSLSFTIKSEKLDPSDCEIKSVCICLPYDNLLQISWEIKDLQLM